MKYRIFIISTLFFLFSLFLSLHTWAFSVQSLRYGVHSDKIRAVIEMDSMVDFRVFVLSEPYRIIVDLPDFSWNAGQINTDAKTGVTALRYGALSDGISRIVMDTGTPVMIKDAFVLPSGSGKPPRLVIDYSKTDIDTFNNTKTRVFGNLNENNVPRKTAISRITDTLTADQSIPNTMTSGAGNATGSASENITGTTTAPAPVPQAKPVRQASGEQGVAAAAAAKNHAPDPSEKPLIVIDPGHGGVDPGAIGQGEKYEKNTVLNLARELKNQLLSTGKYRVMMTREKDVFIKLSDRVKFARQNGADLFVSIHADSVDKPDVKGASIYTLSNKASDAQTAKLAARENRSDLIGGIDLSTEDKEVANILLDLSMRDTMNQSRFFADTIVDSFRKNSVRTLQGPHRHAGFAVLKAPDIPSVLIEVGFMSNRTEAYMLNTPEHRSKMAAAIRSGIDKYFATLQEE